MKVITENSSAAIQELHTASSGENDADLYSTLSNIQAAIKSEGDTALFNYTEQFDKVALSTTTIKVSPQEIKAAYTRIDDRYISACKTAIHNIRSYHEHQKPNHWSETLSNGVQRGYRFSAIHSVGLYVPGGRAIYPSTAIMNSIPARLAGVSRIQLVSPPQPNGSLPDQLLVAADLCGITDIYKAGGAQSIFALAYGTDALPKVDKIVGPGNIYVTRAKQMVYGTVDIDKPAGPSEVCVYLTDPNYAHFAASECLAQLEHDPDAHAIIVSESNAVIEAVSAAIETQLPACKRQEILSQSMQNILAFHSKDNAHSIAIINEIASEHLVLMLDNFAPIHDQIRHAGSIFLGPYTPVTLGDYYAGPNHVLPTAGTARYASPLGVLDFMKYSAHLHYPKTALATAANDLQILTQMESLDAHYHAVTQRLNR